MVKLYILTTPDPPDVTVERSVGDEWFSIIAGGQADR